MTRILIAALLVGCGSGPQTLSPGPCSVEGVTGAVPGVTLAIRSEDCVYSVGEAARFVYEVATDAAVPAIEVPASSGCGSCTSFTADPRSWIEWRILGTSREGADQTYCLCDLGCCAPDPEETIRPEIATVSEVIEWSGRNWGGPSDTGQPQGPFFAPGVYNVRVTFSGFARGSVTAELPIEIIP